MKKMYHGSSLEKCLENAVKEFNLPLEDLKYEILEEKKSIFRKKIIVEVDIPEIYDKKEENLSTKENTNNKQDKLSNISDINEKDGTIKIIEGKIIVTNPKEGGRPAYILAPDNVGVLIDGERVKGKMQVFENSNIEIFFEKAEASRELKIYISEDKLEAYGEIIYKPEYSYKLKDKEEDMLVTLESEIVSEIYPPKYSLQDIKEELAKNNVVYGIIEENLKKCVENSCEKILIAKGEEVVNGEDDKIEIKFKVDEDLKKLKEDKMGNIDFKSIGAIEVVHKGETIAVKHLGKDGQDGCDITGKVKVHKLGKRIRLKAGQGTILKDENTIVAGLDGKPCIKNNTFYVYQLHEIKSDVDLKTGNIKFIGDIIVYGSVLEGMEVHCGNFLTIEKEVERCKVKAKGDVIIKGNVIASNIFGGGEDVEKLRILKDLEQLKDIISKLVEAVEEIKKYNLLGQDRKDGEIIKVLIENKFRMLTRLCMSVIVDLNINDDNLKEKELVAFIKSKLIGIAPINIKHYSELLIIVNSIDEIINNLKGQLSIPVNVEIPYAQDSNVQSSGDVIINGKGEYISDITANGNIYFVQQNSLARGGTLKAKDEIKCKVVGSTGGVSTRLQVDKQGHIWADVAYQNTIFIVGNREFILDIPGKNIHAYLDDSGDIVVDKFKM